MYRYTPDLAGAVYDLLIEICKAPETDRERFIIGMTVGVNEWRFQGNLGFGGKYWANGKVSCYPEDEDAVKITIISIANQKLFELLQDNRNLVSAL